MNYATDFFASTSSSSAAILAVRYGGLSTFVTQQLTKDFVGQVQLDVFCMPQVRLRIRRTTARSYLIDQEGYCICFSSCFYTVCSERSQQFCVKSVPVNKILAPASGSGIISSSVLGDITITDESQLNLLFTNFLILFSQVYLKMNSSIYKSDHRLLPPFFFSDDQGTISVSK